MRGTNLIKILREVYFLKMLHSKLRKEATLIFLLLKPILQHALCCDCHSSS